MLFIKLMTVFMAAAGLAVLAHVRKRSSDDVKAEELIGDWYTIGLANPASDPGILSCDRKIITKGHDDECVNVNGSALWNGSSFSYAGKGKVTNSKLNVEYPEQNIKSQFYLKSFNKGDEVILHDEEDTKHHTLLSRKSTASSEAKEQFAKDAKDDDVKVLWMGQDNCS